MTRSASRRSAMSTRTASCARRAACTVNSRKRSLTAAERRAGRMIRKAPTRRRRASRYAAHAVRPWTTWRRRRREGQPMSATDVPAELLALQRLYHWERAAPERVVLTQPMGGGALREFTWRALIDQARRMAAHLRSQGIAPGDRVAILSKNTAWWLMADFAIWIAGGVSVPLYPTLAAPTIRQIIEHSESKLVFVGKLDGWDAMKSGVPKVLPCIALPLAPATTSPAWDDIVARTPPVTGQ